MCFESFEDKLKAVESHLPNNEWYQLGVAKTKVIYTKELTSLCKDLNQERLENTKNQLLLGIHSHIEHLQDYLWPIGVSKGKLTRYQLWEKIVKSTDPTFTGSKLIVEFQDRLKEETVSPDFFVKKCIIPLYDHTSKIGAHKIPIPPAKDVSDKIIKDMLEMIGLPSDTGNVIAIRISITPLESVD